MSWKNLSSTDWMYGMANAWTSNDHCTVCIVDWRPLSGEFRPLGRLVPTVFQSTNYQQAALRNTKLVANAIHQFIAFLMEHGMRIEHVSIAGHSLGAHIAGYVGASFGGKINAIYGRNNTSLILCESSFRALRKLIVSDATLFCEHFLSSCVSDKQFFLFKM